MRQSLGLSSYLKNLRIRRQIDVRGLAQVAGIGKSTLYDWEAGKAQPRVNEMNAVLGALHATSEEREKAYALMNAPRARAESGGVPHLGELIRSLRVRRGRTQTDIARAMGVRQSTLARWEARSMLPSEAQLDRICQVLGAHPREREALLSPQLFTNDVTSYPDLDFYAAQIESYITCCDPALTDLTALSLKRQIRLLQDNTLERRRLLAHVSAHHAYYLMLDGRQSESKRVVWDALGLIEEMKTPEYFWTSALNIASYHAGASKKRDGAYGAKVKIALLDQWLPRFPQGTMRARMECDMALYASVGTGSEDFVMPLIKSALRNFQIAGRHARDAEGAAYYFRLTYGRVLVNCGKPYEGMKYLPEVQVYDRNSVSHLVYWVDAFLAAGERTEAARILETIKTITASTPVSGIEDKLERLAQQI